MSVTTLLCIAGGGTGGHVMPAISLADAARSRWQHLEVEFIGAERGLEARLLPDRGETFKLITMHSIQGAGMMQRLRVFFWELPRAVMQIWRHWRMRTPRLVVGVGGYASVAGVMAAWLSRIPFILYEQNAVPGMVNRRLAPLSQRIMLGFADANKGLPASKCVYTGNMVASAMQNVRWQMHTPPRLIVLGGSQGAAFLNETVPEACRLLSQQGHKFTVTHVAGEGIERIRNVQSVYKQAGIAADVVGFCDNMPALYAKGDLMIARAGAMTVSEAAMVGMPCLFVPLPHAADLHQHRNAEVLSAHDAAEILDQHSINGPMLADKLRMHLFDRERLQRMHQAALKQAPKDAEQRLLDALSPWLEEYA